MFSRLSKAVISLLFFLLTSVASVSALAYETTLTIEGQDTSGQHIAVTLTRAQLEQLPQTTLTTHLPGSRDKQNSKG